MTNFIRHCALAVTLLLFIVGAPILLMSYAFPSEEVSSAWDRAAFVFAVPLLLTAGFIFVFAFGRHMLRSPIKRFVAAVLLAIPMGAASFPLMSGHAEFRAVAIPMLVFTTIIFSGFVFPAWLRHLEP